MSGVNMARALNDGLRVALTTDERTLLLGEDVGRTGGVFRISDKLLPEFGHNRVFDAPVSESGIIGVGLGLAVGGMRPILEMQFMGFSYPAYDQIICHVSRIRHRSRHRFTAPLVIRIPYGGGIGAAEHHSESTETIYSHVPGLKVVVPSTPADAKGLLLAAVEDPDPVIFLEPIRSYRSVKEDVPSGHYTTPIGEAAVRREGTDITLIGYGAMMREVLAAAQLLEGRGISVEVIDVRSLVPLDSDTLVASVQKTGRAAIIHEAPRTLGFGAEIASLLQERAFFSLEAPVLRISGWNTVFPLKRSERLYLPNAAEIAQEVQTKVLEV